MPTLMELEHLLGIVKDYGPYVMVTFLLIWLIVNGLAKKIVLLIKNHYEATEKVSQFHASVVDPTDPKGEKIIHRYELKEKLDKVGSTVQDVKTTIDAKVCAEACPALSVIANNLEKMNAKLDHDLSGMHRVFREYSEASLRREDETNNLIKGTYDRLNSVMDSTMAGVLALAESLLKSRGNKNE